MTVRVLLRPVLSWGILFGVYLLLTGQASTDELVAACGVAATATGLSVAVRSGPGLVFQLMPRVWLRPALKAAASLPREVMLVGFRLIRPRPGRFEQAPLQPVSANTETTRAVRLIAESLAPNRFAVGIVEGDKMLVHRLVEPRS